MSESQLITDLLEWLRVHAPGNEKARPRKELLAYLIVQGHSLPKGDPDRFMRRLKAKHKDLDTKVGSCLRGYYLITNNSDRKVAQGQLHSHAMSELVREREIRDAGATGEQGSLF
jgi:hypothetical protein